MAAYKICLSGVLSGERRRVRIAFEVGRCSRRMLGKVASA